MKEFRNILHTIQVPKATGGYDNLEVEGQFVVRKPEIVVTSAASSEPVLCSVVMMLILTSCFGRSVQSKTRCNSVLL